MPQVPTPPSPQAPSPQAPSPQAPKSPGPKSPHPKSPGLKSPSPQVPKPPSPQAPSPQAPSPELQGKASEDRGTDPPEEPQRCEAAPQPTEDTPATGVPLTGVLSAIRPPTGPPAPHPQDVLSTLWPERTLRGTDLAHPCLRPSRVVRPRVIGRGTWDETQPLAASAPWPCGPSITRGSLLLPGRLPASASSKQPSSHPSVHPTPAGGIALSAPQGRPGAQRSRAPAPVLQGWVPSRKGQSALQGCPRQAEPLCPAHSARAGPAPDVKRCREGELSETRTTPWPFLRVPSGAKSDRDALRAEEEAPLWVKEGSGHEEATSSPLKGKQGLPAAPGERAVPDPTGLVLQLPADPGAPGSFQTLLTGFGGSGLLTVSPRPSRQEMGRGWASLPGLQEGPLPPPSPGIQTRQLPPMLLSLRYLQHPDHRLQATVTLPQLQRAGQSGRGLCGPGSSQPPLFSSQAPLPPLLAKPG
ncbi:nascent polypeptide-associated complex subunit alpha, muscle-specific form-like [Neofelis nebulosa]|uniref:nascent polypeptide-associated complex subunit alpha, muscle-specific form-like n=1 Tax=Neofelis nebulosa TaxID=61452 RepID=UPI00272C87DA|nr:nascent polypeptide-associated complex subunit alpha, muscle-specific form-like [Neofelis nebulosa]